MTNLSEEEITPEDANSVEETEVEQLPEELEEAEVCEEEVPAELELTREEELEIEVAKWKDQAVRTAAELENYRKRVARDLQEARKYGNSGLLGDLLPVLDNFKMGMDAAAADESSMIYMGMKMVQNQLDEFLSNNGVKAHDPTGQEFDHNLHEAITQEETEEYEEGVIIRTIRPGYTLNDKLLRAANVVVATTPGSEEEETTEEA